MAVSTSVSVCVKTTGRSVTILHFFNWQQKTSTAVGSGFAAIVCSNSKFLHGELNVCRVHQERGGGGWPLTLSGWLYIWRKQTDSSSVKRRTIVSVWVSSTCKWFCLCGFFCSQKASVIEDPQVSWNDLVLQHRSSRNIDPVTVIRDDDDGSLVGVKMIQFTVI